MTEIVDENPWVTIPVKASVKLRMIGFKSPKKNRKKYEHILETLEDVLVRLMDHWDESHPSDSRL